LTHRQLPETKVVFIAIKPSIARLKWMEPMRQANELVEAYTKRDQRLEYIDIFTPMLDPEGRPREELFIEDNLHLNEKGYRLWQRVVRPHLSSAHDAEERSQ
jgi:lysophospholipase L1-like esterase